MRRGLRGFGALLAGLAGLGGDCAGGDGDGGSPAVVESRSPDPACAALASAFPPGFDFVPGLDGRALVAEFAPAFLVSFDVEPEPPDESRAAPPLLLPPDTDGDGRAEIPFPSLDGVNAVDAGLALVTASASEQVLFFRPDAAALRRFQVSVPASFAAGDYPLLPAPGTSALRTALSTAACIRPAPGALDSRGEPLDRSWPAFLRCDPSRSSYLASFSSGAAIAAGRLFVSTSNLGLDPGSSNTQFLPGTVLVFDLDLAADPPRVAPNPTRPVLFTSAFNPTHVTAVAVGGREFVLVTGTGALGLERDDPSTPPIESAPLSLGEAALDVIDAARLELVARYPLGRASPSFDRLAVDPGARIAVAGSAIARQLYAVDLEPLASLPLGAGAPLDLGSAVIFDAARPFRLPALARGAVPESCPGFTAGTAFNAAGDRLYAGDFCDGTLAAIEVDLAGSPPVPLPASRFQLGSVLEVASPLRPDTLGAPRALGALRVRPGRPGIDFRGPDVFFLVGEPEGLLCGLRVESL